MQIIDVIKQHAQEMGETIPEWAEYATQDGATRIQYWERKPDKIPPFYDVWDDYFTTDGVDDFSFPYLCVDWKTPLKITNGMRDYVNQPEATVVDSSEIRNNTETYTMQKDNINPDHYKVGGIETIDYMKAKSTPEEFQGHLRLTAIKYLSRAGHKDNSLQEYKKASWYLNYLIKEIEHTSN